MAQDLRLTEEDVARSEGPPTGGLPADFFDQPEGGSPAAVPDGVSPEPAALPPRAARPGPVARPSPEGRSMLPVVTLVLLGNVILFLGGVLAGWAFAKKEGPPPTHAPAGQASQAPVPPELVRSVESKASREEVARYRDELGELQAEVKRLRGEVASLGQESTRLRSRLEAPQKAVAPAAPDLKPLERKVDALAAEAKALGALPAEVRALGQQFGRLEQALKGLRAEIATVPKQVKEAIGPAPEPAPDSTPVKRPTPADEARRRGLDLLNQGKIAEARDLLLRQTHESPDDARVWYLAALANGFATGDWGGETVRLVSRGLERERAGTPPRAEVDEMFSELGPGQGKDWLRGWRERMPTR